jgi:hypothetical protein
MSVPATREQFKDYCLRALGHPVINIEVDDDQVEDRIDEALQYFQDFHFDAVEHTYLKHQITASDISNNYITVVENVIGINRIFPLSGGTNSVNMFDLQYQMRLNDMQTFTNTSMVNYVITNQHLRMIDMLFNGEIPIRFNRHTDRLYLDWNWTEDAVEGKWIIIDCYTIADPASFSDVWNDRMLKKYCTALIKRQWGNSLKKYDKMQLPGGVMMNGQQIFEEAEKEIADIEDYIRNTYEAPPMFLVG